jgi:uncharacterized protein (DUF1800 family)
MSQSQDGDDTSKPTKFLHEQSPTFDPAVNANDTARLFAAHRFGFGAGLLDVSSKGDPRASVAAQLDALIADKSLHTRCFGALPGSEVTGAVFPNMLRRLAAIGGLFRPRSGNEIPSTGEAAQRGVTGQGDAIGDANTSTIGRDNRAMQRLLPYLEAELEARMRYAVATPAPLIERLVWFWSNHFTVSAKRIGLVALAGSYEREAIRPHVLGRFDQLLLAVLRHPAMQIYLDNFRSVGPSTSAVGSGFGAQRRTGVNENLAREVLELHTLGERNAYVQADVEQFALALTGWGLASGGKFAFELNAHEPGERSVLKRRYPQGGAAQAEAIVADLAVHPATARHIATKLLRNFGRITPQEVDIAAVSAAFISSQGDLRATVLALLHRPKMWFIEASASRLKHADEFAVSAWRTLGLQPPAGTALREQLEALGEPTWFAPSPAGWGPLTAASFSPDALLARLQWTQTLAERMDPALDVRAFTREHFGALLSKDTQREIERAQSSSQALALLLASPEFLHA